MQYQKTNSLILFRLLSQITSNCFCSSSSQDANLSHTMDQSFSHHLVVRIRKNIQLWFYSIKLFLKYCHEDQNGLCRNQFCNSISKLHSSTATSTKTKFHNRVRIKPLLFFSSGISFTSLNLYLMFMLYSNFKNPSFNLRAFYYCFQQNHQYHISIRLSKKWAFF